MNKQITEEEKLAAVQAAITYIVTNSKYSMRQVVDTLAVVDKWDDKAIYHCSKKQKEILGMFEELLGGLW